MAFDSNDRRPAYRPFAPEDIEPVAELFYRQWGTEAGERLGRLDARINVCNYLMDADWGVVAEGVDGRLLGALLVETGAQTEAMRSSWRTRREELLAQVAPGATFGHEVCRVEAEELASLKAIPREGRRSAGSRRGIQAPDRGAARHEASALAGAFCALARITCARQAPAATISSQMIPVTWGFTTIWAFLAW